jgi:hypothetical protein
MTNRFLHCLVPLNYDISRPFYSANEIVRRRSYLTDDMVQRKSYDNCNIDTITASTFAEKLKTKAVKKNNASSTSSESSFRNENTNKQDFTLKRCFKRQKKKKTISL